MTTDRLPLFCDAALAERIERAEAQLVAGAAKSARARQVDAAGFVVPVAGGVASFAGEDSPFNKVAGLGFAGVSSATVLARLSGRLPPATPRYRSSWPTSPIRRSVSC